MYNISKILLTILLSFKKLSDANICKLWTTISILTFENTFEYILAICYSTTKVFPWNYLIAWIFKKYFELYSVEAAVTN